MASLHTLNPRADLLRREQALMANVVAANGLKDVVASNLGPKGTLKMLVGGSGQIKTTKDGNVLLKEMQIQHPCAALVARAATAQDQVTGDGSTSSVILTGEIMKLAQREISEGVHPRLIAEGLDLGRSAAVKFLEKSFKHDFPNVAHDRELLTSVARCSLITKVEREMAEQLTSILVDSVQCVMGDADKMEEETAAGVVPLDLYKVEVLGMKQGLVSETRFIKGMVMDHGCRHPDMPQCLDDCYILTCNVSLEYEKTEVNSSFMYSNADQRARLANAERRFTDLKVKAIIDLKNKVCTPENKKGFAVFNQKGIDPPSLELLARNGIMALRRVKRRNMERLSLCCGGSPLNAFDGMTESDLGFAASVWETALGDEKYTFVEGVKNPRACAILIRAPSDHALEQIKDAIRDGLRAIKNAITDRALVPGAAAFPIALSHHLRELSETDPEIIARGKARLGIHILADALLALPRALAKNAGHDPRDSLLTLQTAYRTQYKSHTEKCGTEKSGTKNNEDTPLPDVGLDLDTGEIFKPSARGVWDALCVHKQMIVLATTLTGQLLLVDEIIKAGRQMGR